ncbi:FAD binding domain-containing protein [Actinomadura fibrosa]|uniref:FAD binding domain-containing protein n=1 Tax=Actinomadura fibrosa TaxID=111802 RepID=UPI001041A2E2|nr:FAD binding domain-containing protein [Actinomadura fibrosa]
MKAAAFGYHAPEGAAEAVSLLAGLGEDAKPIAGGQSLVPMLALRLAMPEHLVDLRRADDLRGVERRNGDLWIGAMTSQAAIEGSAAVARDVPLLARATPLIGHFQIRNRGTLGGSLSHGDAAAEYPAVALALGARFEVLSPRGRRTVAAADFFTGVYETDLAEDEILTGAAFPVRRDRSGFAVEEFARRRGDFAIAGAAVAVELDPGGRVARCGIGLFGLGSTPLRAAADTFDALGARPWAERAHRELRASGETRRSVAFGIDQLTPQELQVARLVAQGLSNREIGERLFLSPRTIGSHLYRIYPKAGVGSRTELATVIVGSDPD